MKYLKEGDSCPCRWFRQPERREMGLGLLERGLERGLGLELGLGLGLGPPQ